MNERCKFEVGRYYYQRNGARVQVVAIDLDRSADGIVVRYPDGTVDVRGLSGRVEEWVNNTHARDLVPHFKFKLGGKYLRVDGVQVLVTQVYPDGTAVVGGTAYTLEGHIFDGYGVKLSAEID